MANTQESTSAKLRSIRKSKGWSLQDVETNSRGKWKAVVIGSYERSDRAISLKKAIDLMNFYQVPISALFDAQKADIQNHPILQRLILDQRSISQSLDENLVSVKVMIAHITAKRQDWNGQVLSLRAEDLQFLAILLNRNTSETISYLKENKYLIK
jgi:transcriptional regulator with XRE-family HTH domain